MSRQFAVLIVALIGIHAGDLLAAPPKLTPEIFSLTPNEGPADQLIELKGAMLADTKHVYFCVGRSIREAKFKVISAEELQVTAPAFFGPGASATVVVATTIGVTVGMPASALKVDKILSHGGGAESFSQVVKDGVLTSPSGIVFVEEGGVAEAPSQAGLCFVKNGGSLLKLNQFSGLIFHEPKTQVQTSQERRRPHHSIRVVQAAQVSASVGIDPFIYQRPEQPQTPAESAPKVTSVSPQRAALGMPLTLKGSGFLETSKVLAMTSRGASELGFRVDSDHQLQVDLPDTPFGQPLLVVINPKGATVVLSHAHMSGRASSDRPMEMAMQVVKAKTVVSNGNGSRNYFIENGGVVAKTGGSCVFFVKKGGRMSLNSGAGSLTVFYEDDADIDNDHPQGGGHTLHQVASISMSVVSGSIEIAHP